MAMRNAFRTSPKDLMGVHVTAVVMGIVMLTVLASAAWCSVPGDVSASPDLSQLSLEDLLNIKVTSVSKKAEKVSESAAAVYVITREDLRRSGVTSIPEALRMVPGLQVTSVNSHTWAITSRGFNDRFANKMLVLIDGRSVYTPLFSGTWWDVQDTLLEDIERIEVIRGPGATMWGANAVNGVINIITRTAGNSRGSYLSYNTGSNSRSLSELRYGGSMGHAGSYRIYAKYFDRSTFVDASGNDAEDAWSQTRTGFRVDRDLSETDSLTVHGDVYNGFGSQKMRGNSFVPPYEPVVVDDYDYSGSDMLARWTRTESERSEMALQLYYGRTERSDIQHSETRNTWDIDFQKRRSLSDTRELMWGVGYRYSADNIGETSYIVVDPKSDSSHLFNAFVQREMAFPDKKLRLTFGSKFEHNEYTGFELQPNIRMLWSPDEHHTVWGAVSRAVRTPTRAENDITYTLRILPPGAVAMPPGTPLLPVKIDFAGSRDLDSEKLIAYELGYRIQPSDDLSVDLAAFYNDYKDIRAIQRGEPYPVMSPAPHIVVPMQWVNLGRAQTHGLEIAANWRAGSSWRLGLGYTWTHISIEVDPSTGDPYTENYMDYVPKDQVSLRSYLDINDKLSLDTMVYYVDSVPAHSVPGYIRTDMRIGWRPSRDSECSLVIQNMLDKQHREFGGTLSEIPMEVPRTVYLKYARSY